MSSEGYTFWGISFCRRASFYKTLVLSH